MNYEVATYFAAHAARYEGATVHYIYTGSLASHHNPDGTDIDDWDGPLCTEGRRIMDTLHNQLPNVYTDSGQGAGPDKRVRINWRMIDKQMLAKDEVAAMEILLDNQVFARIVAERSRANAA